MATLGAVSTRLVIEMGLCFLLTNQTSDPVEAQAPDESCFVAVVAQDPIGVAERGFENH